MSSPHWKQCSIRFSDYAGSFRRGSAARLGLSIRNNQRPMAVDQPCADLVTDLFAAILLDRTFPHNRGSPSRLFESRERPLIPEYILLEFLRPELGSSGGCGCEPAAFVTMPEASMDEHDCPKFRKDQIGFPRQSLAVQPISQAPCMQRFSQGEFGLRVSPLDPRHHSGPRRLVDNVGHHEFPWLVPPVLVCG